MNTLDTLLQRMESETDESLAAARAGNLESCTEALARRDETLRELAECLDEPSRDEAERLAAAAERIQTQDATLVQLLEQSREEARSDLDLVRTARQTARNSAPHGEPARFVCERV